MSTVEFEDILFHAGSRGRWQWLIFFVASLSGFFNAFHHLGYVFLVAEPDHWCSLPIALKDEGWTTEQWKNFSIPTEIRDEKRVFSQCSMYDTKHVKWDLMMNESVPNDTATVPCRSWDYDYSRFESTIVTEWDLVCQYKPLISTVQATYMAGVFLGCLVYGVASDRFGRRSAILVALTCFTTSGVLASFSVHYIMFIALRLIIAMSAAGMFTCTFVLTTEIAEPNLRSMFGIFFEIPFAVGYMTLSGIAYLIRDWKHLQLAISIPSILMISFVWLLPESPRWLISKGKFDQALKVLKRAARLNKKKLPADSEMLLMMKVCKENEEEAKHSQLQKFGIGIFFDLFRNWTVAKRTLTVYFTWFVVSMVYYGLAFNVKNFGDNMYLVNFLNAAVEIPAYILVYGLIVCGGRRLGYCCTFLAGGVACLVILALKDEWVITGFAVLGKFLVTATFAISYLFTAELFPTSVRNVALNSSSMCGRIGSIIAPYVIELPKIKGFNIPMALFGGLAVAAGLLSLLLPETNKRNLTENWHLNTRRQNSDAGNSSSDNILGVEEKSPSSDSTLATNF